MDAEQFRQQVDATFGPHLRQATYENVRRFVAWFNDDHPDQRVDLSRYVLVGDPEESLEASVKLFLDETLEGDAETARQRLWVATLELWFAIFQTADEDSFARMIDELGHPTEGSEL